MASESVTRKDELAANLAAVRELIDVATAKAGREQGSVALLPVTKFHPAADIALLAELGVIEVAENREQEAREKAAALPQVKIHMIGQIQTKKANSVARWAHAVHSVDSVKLALALDRGVALAIERNDRAPGPLTCFVQLSLDGDASRGGCSLDGIDELADVVDKAEHLQLAGVMCVPPLGVDPNEAFAQAAGVVSRLAKRYGRHLEFSAGMSGDLAAAIANGSTMVRVGTAILGPRPLG
ncbi:YggS family pyridoxal phosphate-dependent enzyme [Staphylococcus chromogenes]|nr:YggS family pyridoxal phosphate-dependent enzyme [Staphylococcus chromogenes]